MTKLLFSAHPTTASTGSAATLPYPSKQYVSVRCLLVRLGNPDGNDYPRNADGVILTNVGDRIDTTDTSKELHFDTPTTVDYNNDGQYVQTIDWNWGGVDEFYINDNGEFIYLNQDTHSKFIPNEGKQFKVSYDANNNMWHIAQV